MQKKIALCALLFSLATSLQGQSFSHIYIENDSTPPAAVNELIAKAKNQEMKEEEIALFVKNITNIYIQKGYITSYVSIEEGDLNRGNLILSLKKGRIGKIVSEDSHRLALPFRSGEVLTIQKIDQLTENLKTSLTDVNITIVPSERTGYSDIYIQTKRKKQIEVVATLDNDSYKDHGRENVQLSLSRDSTLFSGDLFTTSWKERLTENREKYRKSVYNLSYTVPVGFSKLQYQFSREDSTETVLNSRYKTKKREDNHKLEVSRVFARNARQKWEAYSFVNIQKNRNYFGGIKLDVSSKTHSRLGFGLRNIYYIPNGYVFTDFGFEKGIPFLGGEGDEKDAKVRDPFKKEFMKWVLSMNGSKSFLPNQFGYFNYSFRVSAAYTQDHLLDSNKFEMGGINSVRGFKESTVKGDRGISIQNTLSLEGKHWAPFIGLDYGLSRDGYRDGHDEIMGIAAGLRYHRAGFNAELTFSKALKLAKEMPKESPPIYFKVSYKF